MGLSSLCRDQRQKKAGDRVFLGVPLPCGWAEPLWQSDVQPLFSSWDVSFSQGQSCQGSGRWLGLQAKDAVLLLLRRAGASQCVKKTGAMLYPL